VIATGLARLVRDPHSVHHYEQALKPWGPGVMDQVIAITPHMITGIRLTGCCG
jgi:hypothetical protein